MTKFEAFQLLGLTGDVTNSDIKKAYRKKAQYYHPDRNPAGAEIMKMLNIAYDLIKNEEKASIFENSAINDYPDEIAAALNMLRDLPLNIEVCGLWVWVSGDTKPHKEVLKAAKFRWAFKKAMWYFRPASAKSPKYYKGNTEEWDMGKIRAKFGSSQNQRPYIAKQTPGGNHV